MFRFTGIHFFFHFRESSVFNFFRILLLFNDFYLIYICLRDWCHWFVLCGRNIDLCFAISVPQQTPPWSVISSSMESNSDSVKKRVYQQKIQRLQYRDHTHSAAQVCYSSDLTCKQYKTEPMSCNTVLFENHESKNQRRIRGG